MVADFNKATRVANELLISNPIYQQRNPVDFVAILNDLGLNIAFNNDMEDEALLDPINKTIYIKRMLYPQRMFFSIAHEIGHWLLHSRDKIRYRKNTPEFGTQEAIEEQEANAFAAELLLPFDKVAEHIRGGFDIASLASTSNVSYDFASFRYNFVATRLMYGR
ncbi:ImmA/IrrE family metallo-endopeptidase [Campylobacter sp. RM9333]|nr:ImmA/IrrE family metallo-endopeptidase [Campylobacter sp. RM9333]